LTYWLAAEATLSKKSCGVIFYDLKEGEVKKGLVEEESIDKSQKAKMTRGHVLPESKVASLLEDGLTSLKSISEKINSGDFTPAPSSSHCSYCDFAPLCRQGEGYA
jgi:hypothetical protein